MRGCSGGMFLISPTPLIGTQTSAVWHFVVYATGCVPFFGLCNYRYAVSLSSI